MMGNRFSHMTPFTIEVLNLTLAKRTIPTRASVHRSLINKPLSQYNTTLINANDDFGPGSPRLCELCETEDFYSLLNKPGLTSNAPIFVQLGRVKDIVDRAKGCRFCSFLYLSIGSTIPLKHDAPDLEDNVALYAVKEIGEVDRGRQNGSFKIIDGALLAETLEILETRGLTKIVPFTQTPAPKIIDCQTPMRLMSGLVDSTMLASWFHHCRDSHHLCQPEEWRKRPGLRFRLIDVSKRYVVEPTDVPEYAALSYVWGLAKHFVLRYENFDILTQPGGLSDYYNDIPKTFNDAIELAAQLGFRYLWIDALCINQDDPNDKLTQIANMDRIYASAQLTIISDSSSAHTGIPGISRLSRPLDQAVYVCDGVALVNARPDFEEAMSWSPWETRGWTFQEKYFSKRQLILTESQAFYHCQRHLCKEHILSAVDGPSSPKNPLWVSSPSRRSVILKPGESQKLQHGMGADYYTLVDGYFPRELSNDKDSIHAFSGVLESRRSELGAHIWGLPESIFHDALLWKPDFHSLSHRNREFPSWSWAGWMTGRGIDSHYEGIYGQLRRHKDTIPWKEFRPTWFLLQQNQADKDTLNHVQIRCNTGAGLRHHLPSHADKGLAMEAFHYNGDCMPPISHILRSWVMSILLYVDRKPCDENKLDQRYEYTLRTRADGEGIGSIILDPSWRESRPEYLEFITLSARIPPLEYPLYLMLIEWDESGIAYRVQACYLDLGRELTFHGDGGVGPVCIPVEDVDPVWKLISLA